MGGVGWTEVLVVVAILVLLFGASKIPELARGVGEGINEFRKVTDTDNNEANEVQSDSDDKRSESKEVKG